MTEKELELKRWLNRAFYADKKTKALAMLVQQCRERAQSVSICCEGNDKGKSDGSKNGTLEALNRLLDMQDRYMAQMNELLDIIEEIKDAIAQLNDPDLESVLINRYLNFLTHEQTAEVMHYSVPTIKRKISVAIQKLIPFDLV